MVTALSVFEAHPDTAVQINVVTDSLSDDHTRRFLSLASTSPLHKVRIHILDNLDIDSINQLVVRSRFPKSMYFRLFIPEILQLEYPEVQRVLYLDCDIMIRHSLSPFFAEPFIMPESSNGGTQILRTTDIHSPEALVLAAIDQQTDDVCIYNRLNLPPQHDYFNSGVLMLNLPLWRKEGITQQIIRFLENNPEKCLYPDQDALNYVLARRVKYIDPNYNFQEMWLTMPHEARIDHNRFPWLKNLAEGNNVINDPAVVHFCSSIKPWHSGCRNPFAAQYRALAISHPEIPFKIQHRHSFIHRRIEAEIQRLRRWQSHFS